MLRFHSQIKISLTAPLPPSSLLQVPSALVKAMTFLHLLQPDLHLSLTNTSSPTLTSLPVCHSLVLFLFSLFLVNKTNARRLNTRNLHTWPVHLNTTCTTYPCTKEARLWLPCILVHTPITSRKIIVSDSREHVKTWIDTCNTQKLSSSDQAVQQRPPRQTSNII